ncbi:GntR family transcriptional regulator [Kineosporia mesophila]|uniref:GntR family transcriptional regulator n=1 Tax=Kineosporia mesophila TaxID=566012 RepID=A0ABP7A484_9ACTN|nr:GntR family transcriptional regulator [Kineosporia mesophila]MCD5353815.1 GntR family transcriptional regulator [Kineosporia mesophila]
MAIGHRELAEKLREGIQRGAYPPDSTLPKQDELAAEYGVNIKTVRQAVGLLAAEGLVTPVRRRGTVVRSRPPMKRLGIERYAKSKWKFGLVAFAADREASGREWKPTDQTQTISLVPADELTADALQISIGEPVYARARLVKDANSPTHTLTSYYRPEDVADTPLVDPEPGPAGRGGGFQVLTLKGLEPHHIRESFHARMPTPEEIATLELPQGEPVVVLHRTTFTEEGQPVESAVGVHSASRFTWTYEFDIPE